MGAERRKFERYQVEDRQFVARDECPTVLGDGEVLAYIALSLGRHMAELEALTAPFWLLEVVHFEL